MVLSLDSVAAQFLELLGQKSTLQFASVKLVVLICDLIREQCFCKTNKNDFSANTQSLTNSISALSSLFTLHNNLTFG